MNVRIQSFLWAVLMVFAVGASLQTACSQDAGMSEPTTDADTTSQAEPSYSLEYRVPQSATWLTPDQRKFLQAVMDKLVDIGDPNRAKRMVTDIAHRRIRIVTDEAGVRASTYQNGGSNVMDLQQSTVDDWTKAQSDSEQFRSKAESATPDLKEKLLTRSKQRAHDVRSTILDAALTVDHEYVHMDQTDPGEEPKYENPAWRRRLDEENRLIDVSVMALEQSLQGELKSDADVERLDSAIEDLQTIGELHEGSVNELGEKISPPPPKPGEEKKLPTLSRDLFEQDRAEIGEQKKKIAQLIARAKNKIRDRNATVASAEVPKSEESATKEQPQSGSGSGPNGEWMCTSTTLGGTTTTKFGTTNLPSGFTVSYPMTIKLNGGSLSCSTNGRNFSIPSVGSNTWAYETSQPPPASTTSKMSLTYDRVSDSFVGESTETFDSAACKGSTRASLKLIRKP